jgi:hypothetical protein
VQHLVPVHERCLHPLDSVDVLRSLGIQLRGLVPQGLRPVHQPSVRSPQGLDEGVEGVVLPPVLAEIGASPSKLGAWYTLEAAPVRAQDAP